MYDTQCCRSMPGMDPLQKTTLISATGPCPPGSAGNAFFCVVGNINNNNHCHNNTIRGANANTTINNTNHNYHLHHTTTTTTTTFQLCGPAMRRGPAHFVCALRGGCDVVACDSATANVAGAAGRVLRSPCGEMVATLGWWQDV